MLSQIRVDGFPQQGQAGRQSSTEIQCSLWGKPLVLSSREEGFRKQKGGATPVSR